MKIEQSFTVKPQISSSDRPAIYKEKVPSCIENNQNTTKFFPEDRLSKSDPLNFFEREQSNSQKSIKVIQEEIKLKKKIFKVKNSYQKHELKRDQFEKELKEYNKYLMEASLKKDMEMMLYWANKDYRCFRQIRNENNTIFRLFAMQRELEKQLQNLQYKII